MTEKPNNNTENQVIPLSIPSFQGNEWKYVKECIDTGWVSMAGAYVNKFEETVAKYVGAKHGVAAVNGTSALHMALHLLGVGENDKVILPNITFVASANSVAYTGAESIFVDVDQNTWQIDLNLLENWLDQNTLQKNDQCYLKKDPTKRVAAVMAVHVLGNMCDMERLSKICKTHKLKLVEDASESLGTYFKGKHSGTFCDIGVFSFNGNKIITTGGGGVLVTDDAAIAKRAKHLTTQAKVNVETYYHDEIGYNYRLVNILAALGVAQMEQLDSFIKIKKSIDAFYRKHLTGVGDIRFQKIEEEVNPNCWLFTFYSSKKDEILQARKENKIIARPFWYPMNQLPMFKENIYVNDADFSRKIHENCISIPCSVGISEKEMLKVLNCITKVF